MVCNGPEHHSTVKALISNHAPQEFEKVVVTGAKTIEAGGLREL